MWLKLTGFFNGDPVLINMDKIAKIVIDKDGDSRLQTGDSRDTEMVTVRESLDEILSMLNSSTQKGTKKVAKRRN